MSTEQVDKPLTRLAKEILAKAEVLDEYFATSGDAYPSLENENDINLSLRGAPESVIAARVALINDCSYVTELLTDPVDAIANISLPVSSLSYLLVRRTAHSMDNRRTTS
jgi:hypothetical protein